MPISRFFLISSLFFLSFSCTKSENDELTLNGSSTLQAVYTDTITVNASVVALFPTLTSNRDYLLFGKYIDPNFGEISATAFTQVGVNFAAIAEDAIYDSTVIHIGIDYKHGEIAKPQSVYIHRLTENILNVNHTSMDSSSYDPDPLNEELYFLPISSSVDLKLKDELGIDIFRRLKSTSADFASQDNFSSYFNGLAIVPGADNIAVFGMFSNTQNPSFITVFYHSNGSTTASSINFSISTKNPQYHQIKYNYSDSRIAGLVPGSEISTSQLNGKGYLASGSGLVTKLTFPYLDKFTETVGKVAINKAELIIENVLEYNSFTPPPASIELLETDNSNKLLYINSDNSVSPHPRAVQENLPSSTFLNMRAIPIPWNPSLNNYNAPITYYIEALINKKKPNGGIFLYPSQMGSTVNNLVIGDQSYPNNKNLKLKIYYSILNPAK